MGAKGRRDLAQASKTQARPIPVELGRFRPSIAQLEAMAEDHAAIAADLRAQIAARRASGTVVN